MQFKDKYILGSGYPWVYGTIPHTRMGLCIAPTGITPVKLDWPSELWNKNLPEYRIVLERVIRQPVEL